MDGLKLSQGCRIISRLRSHVAWSTWWLKMASQVGLEEPMYRRYTSTITTSQYIIIIYYLTFSPVFPPFLRPFLRLFPIVPGGLPVVGCYWLGSATGRSQSAWVFCHLRGSDSESRFFPLVYLDNWHGHISLQYIYIYIYIERDRNRDRDLRKALEETSFLTLKYRGFLGFPLNIFPSTTVVR